MPRAFLIKKKQSTLGNGSRPLSPKLYSPSSSGISSPIPSNASTSSSSPRNDENDLATFQTSSPKYSFDREGSQCLDLSMKSLLKEANSLSEKSIKMEFPGTFSTPLFQEPHFTSGYSYPGKFAKIADFLRTREVSKTSFAPASVSPLVPSPAVHLLKNPMAAQVSPATASSLFKPVNYSSIENVSAGCNRLAPYSINWSEHFSVNKLVSPTPSSHGSDDSGRGSEHSEDMSLNDSEASKYGKMVKKSDRYQCPDCNKSYSTQSGLAKHQEFHCSSQVKKSFSCKHCEKVYVSLGALKMHIRTHTLPCKCKLCGKAFSRPWLLQGHIRTHTGEKPFSCQFCNRSFADRSNLRAHLQTHSVVKKYNCQTCSRTFSRMSLLLKHQDNGCNAASRSLSSCSPVHMDSMSVQH